MQHFIVALSKSTISNKFPHKFFIRSFLYLTYYIKSIIQSIVKVRVTLQYIFET